MRSHVSDEDEQEAPASPTTPAATSPPTASPPSATTSTTGSPPPPAGRLSRTIPPGGFSRQVFHLYRAFDDADLHLKSDTLRHLSDEFLKQGESESYVSALDLHAKLVPDAISFVALGAGLESIQDYAKARVAYMQAREAAVSVRKMVRYAYVASLRFCVETKDVVLAHELISELLQHVQTLGPSEDEYPVELDVLEPLRVMGADRSLLDALAGVK